MKHTPAPWYFSNEGVLMVRAKDDDEVVCSYAGYENCEREYANANLIAAAPDLLAVLQLIISYHDDGNCELHSEDVAMARAAISKALGEE
ncbi:TPA: hypothetical protein ACOEMI_002630 [Enterobacter ludwigii]